MAKTAGIVSAQLNIPLPRKVIAVDPPLLGTADCPAICRCDDSCDYAIKDGQKHPLVPHSEWFCTRLADLLGIPGPECQILEMPDGRLVFGSRWEGGVVTGGGPLPAWVAKVQSGEMRIDGLRIPLTRIYAYDLFIHNPDRHGGNFLVREQHNGFALLAFDYSRAWAVNATPLPRDPFDKNHPSERTIKCQRQLSQVWGSSYIDLAEADTFLGKIKRIPKQEIVRIIDQHPKNWLPSKARQDIVKWIEGNDCENRRNIGGDQEWHISLITPF
jgi:hypothetical protein